MAAVASTSSAYGDLIPNAAPGPVRTLNRGGGPKDPGTGCVARDEWQALRARPAGPANAFRADPGLLPTPSGWSVPRRRDAWLDRDKQPLRPVHRPGTGATAEFPPTWEFLVWELFQSRVMLLKVSPTVARNDVEFRRGCLVRKFWRTGKSNNKEIFRNSVT